jgi:hypothetical protein
MGYLRDLMIGAAGSLIAAEAYVHAHRLARWIVERAIARLPAEERERRREEWLADLNDMIGMFEKLLWALGCYWAATVTNVSAWRIADVYIYECQDHTVKLELTKFDHTGVSGTINLRRAHGGRRQVFFSRGRSGWDDRSATHRH